MAIGSISISSLWSRVMNIISIDHGWYAICVDVFLVLSISLLFIQNMTKYKKKTLYGPFVVLIIAHVGPDSLHIGLGVSHIFNNYLLFMGVEPD